jgi:glycosyl transferase family 4
MRDRIPTPQGAGVAAIATTLISAVAVIALAGAAQTTIPIAVFGATLFIAAVGFADDVKSIPIVVRLLLQGIAVAAVMLAASESLRIVPACPLCVERGLLLLAGLWFVNLVNFMDGLDLLTAAEIVPISKRGVRAQSRAGCAGDRLRDDPVNAGPTLRHRRHHYRTPDAPLLAPAARRLIQLLPCEFADQAGVVGHRCVEIETPGYLGRAFGPPRVF